MYKIVIIAEPQRNIVIDLVDLDSKTPVSRAATTQPQLIDYLQSLMPLYEVNKITLCGPTVYTDKIKRDIKREFPNIEVEGIH